MAKSGIIKLNEISEKPTRLIVGLMSGTSLDGLDIALCRFAGAGQDVKAEVLRFETVPYSESFIADVREVFAKKTVSLEKLCLLNAFIADEHASMVVSALKNWNISAEEVDCIASHGQTVYHAPKRLHGLHGYPDATLQIGDGDRLAVKTGIITISDFRQKHAAAGGEGAPLALYGDYLLFTSKSENRVLLNIGGISNFTCLPSNDDAAIISTDAGPGNTLIDAVAKKYFGVAYDEGGALALSGTVNEMLLNEMMQHPFFSESLPKTTGPELFNTDFVDNAIECCGQFSLSNHDLLATVTELTARAIADLLISMQMPAATIYASGGGAHNGAIIGSLEKILPKMQVKPLSALGINPDAKEALLFALLANECLAGEPQALGSAPAITMGKISLPG
ncbi:MAG: anhydro-N-acetylmuramic acid kinase [Sphingobacteriaceae bacterium]|jgi:anhydro-N-acetylmuramic acid kinase|nr:anhydro-N-acetylmuramic acid kinase [Sphingobacteriaceae bacterium]